MPRRRANHQGSVYQRKTGLWCAAISLGKRADGRRLRKNFYARTRREVEQILSAYLRELRE